MQFTRLVEFEAERARDWYASGCGCCHCSTGAALPAPARWPASTGGCSSGSRRNPPRCWSGRVSLSTGEKAMVAVKALAGRVTMEVPATGAEITGARPSEGRGDRRRPGRHHRRDRARRGGRHVTLLEARPRLGGATCSFSRDGLIVDTGQHIFLGCCSAYRGLLDKLGMAGHAPMQDRFDVTVLAPGADGQPRRPGSAGMRCPAPCICCRLSAATVPFFDRTDVGYPARLSRCAVWIPPNPPRPAALRRLARRPRPDRTFPPRALGPVLRLVPEHRGRRRLAWRWPPWWSRPACSARQRGRHRRPRPVAGRTARRRGRATLLGKLGAPGQPGRKVTAIEPADDGGSPGRRRWYLVRPWRAEDGGRSRGRGGPGRPAREGRAADAAGRPARADRRGLGRRAGRLAHRQRARDLRPAGDGPAVRGRRRLPGAVGLRPHPHLRASLLLSAGGPDASTWPSRCRPRTSTRTPRWPELQEQFVPALAELFPAARDADGRRVLRHPRTAGDVSPGAGQRRAAAQGRHAAARPGAGRRVDRYRLAGHDGGRGAQRPGRGGRTAPDRPETHLTDWGASVTAVMPEGVALARDLVGPAMEAAIARLTPAVRAVAAYHFGFADAAGNPMRELARRGQRQGAAARARPAVRARRGRAARARRAPPRWRSSWCTTSRCCTTTSWTTTPSAGTGPTAWTVFGVGAAILAGDALLALAQDLLLEDDTLRGAVGVPLPVRRGAAADRRAGRGPGLREARRRDPGRVPGHGGEQDRGPDGLRLQHRRGAPGRAAARWPWRLAGFGGHVGLAFQLTDDLLGIWGAPEVTGKPVRADLRARKKSLPVVAALTSGQPEAADAARAAHQRGAADRGRPGPRGRPDRGGGRQGLGRGRGRRPAGQGQREPGQHRPGRRRAATS